MLNLPLRLLASVAVTSLLWGGPAVAEMTKSLNINGTTGLIDMPSGEAQDDATFSFSTALFGPISRTTISFQFTERLSASFRFLTWRDWNSVVPGADEIKDRAFDIRYHAAERKRFCAVADHRLDRLYRRRTVFVRIHRGDQVDW